MKSSGQLQRGTSVILTQHMQPDGTLDWDVPPGTWQVFTFKELPTGLQVNAGIGDGPVHVGSKRRQGMQYANSSADAIVS
ncbi:MAG TPA: hypothetical protein VND66_07700 [Acidobacteriaceae bacterium]|nr:hypothetical protein [Acidobacteriaceae bacterium]